ncbi:MAG: hypothetical protein JO092_00910 [Candidatus Eremiobacteraeota bacterium]|nr:hypothetical protein [Candidatus Eremiobacteraeota bacterium]
MIALSLRIYTWTLRLSLPNLSDRGLGEVRTIAGDYLTDAYGRGGILGLAAAWQRLFADLAVNASADMLRAFSPLVLFACALIGICDFVFGDDPSGVLFWALALLAITTALALCLGTFTIRRIALLVATDTLGGACSILMSEHSLLPVVRDDLCWIPVAVFIIIAGSSIGATLRRTLALT